MLHPSCMALALYQSRLRPHASSTKRILQCQMDSLPLEGDALGVPLQAASSVPTGCAEHSSLDSYRVSSPWIGEDLDPRRRRGLGTEGGRGGGVGNLLGRRVKGLRERLLDFDLFDEL